MCGTAVSSKLATCTKRRPLLDPVEPDTAPCLTGNNCHKGPAIPCLAAFVCLAALVAPSSSRWRELNRSPRSMWGEPALAALVSLFSSRWRNCTAVLVRCGGSELPPRPPKGACAMVGGSRRCCGAALVPRGACAMAEGVVGAAARPWSPGAPVPWPRGSSALRRGPGRACLLLTPWLAGAADG